MALTVNSTGNNTGPAVAESATGTFSFTNTAGTILYVCVSGFRNRTMTTLTYNLVTMTSVKRQANGSDIYTEWFRLVSPATGSNTVAWTLSGTDAPTFGLISFTGQNATPEGTTGGGSGTSNAPSTTIATGTANSFVIDSVFINGNNTRTKGGSQTQISNVNDTVFGTEGSVSSYQPTTTTGNYTNSWSLSTSPTWIQAVVEVKPAAGVATNSGFFRATMN